MFRPFEADDESGTFCPDFTEPAETASVASMAYRLASFCLILPAMTFFSSPLGAAKPLSEAAAVAAKTLPKGMIVSAEARGGEVIYASAGEAIPHGFLPEKVVFEIGSISKVFTGLLLAQAVTEGKVRLDTKLAEVVDGELDHAADPRIGAITLRQLATHTSGLPRLPGNFEDGIERGNPYLRYDRAKLMRYLSTAKLPADPPFDPDYSNLGMGLLGDVMARLYRKPWSELVVEKIASPLGMKDTMVVLGQDQQARFALPYKDKDEKRPWEFDALAGCGALRSTAADMVIFGRALMHPETTPLAEAIRLAEQPHCKNGEYGLALMLTQPGGQKAFEHNGSTGGFRSVLQVVPAAETVRVILANNASVSPEKILASARGEMPRLRDSGKVLTPAQLTAYTGVYRLSQRVKITVVAHEGQLWAQFTGQSYLRVFPHEDEDRFFYKAVAAEMQFHRGEKGVDGLTFFQNGRVTLASKTDDPVPSDPPFPPLGRR